MASEGLECKLESEKIKEVKDQKGEASLTQVTKLAILPNDTH